MYYLLVNFILFFFPGNTRTLNSSNGASWRTFSAFETAAIIISSFLMFFFFSLSPFFQLSFSIVHDASMEFRVVLLSSVSFVWVCWFNCYFLFFFWLSFFSSSRFNLSFMMRIWSSVSSSLSFVWVSILVQLLFLYLWFFRFHYSLPASNCSWCLYGQYGVPCRRVVFVVCVSVCAGTIIISPFFYFFFVFLALV